MRSDFKYLGELPPERPVINGYKDFAKDFPNKLFVTEDECVKQCLENIIMTKRGERIMNPLFGTSLIGKIGEPHGPFDDVDMLGELIQAINWFEPRVETLNSRSYVKSDPENHTVQIYITYRIVRSGEVSKYDKTLKY